jgi:hypothetical protein
MTDLSKYKGYGVYPTEVREVYICDECLSKLKATEPNTPSTGVIGDCPHKPVEQSAKEKV